MTMPQAKVAMNVRKVSDTVCTVAIEGKITAFAENVLMDAFTEASAADARSIILDVSGLEYMNSSGIGLLVTLLIRANRQGQKLLATGLNQHYQHIFELTRLNEAIHIFPTEAAALAAT